MSSDGSAVNYGTYLGAERYDVCNGITVDASGAAFVVGTTSSAQFPLSTSPAQRALNGGYDAFVAKLSPDGRSLPISTFLGGSSVEDGNAVTLDSSGNIYIGGATFSPDFPVTSGAPK